MTVLRVALAQINSTVGDLAGNAKKISDYIKKATRYKADIIAFPELALTGYPPEDLILKPQFISDNMAELRKISSRTHGITVITGFVDMDKGSLYNAAAVISEGRVIDVYHKIFLPNYGVFDEHRYFKPGRRFPLYQVAGAKIGISICEDIWHREGPARVQALAGAEVIININASPYEMGKPELRGKILKERSSENAVMIAYLNAVGGQDELVFDGFSMVYDHEGSLIARGKQFEEDLMVLDLDIGRIRKFRKGRKQTSTQVSVMTACAVKKIKIPAAAYPERKRFRQPVAAAILKREEEVYRALVLGTSDYVKKNGFTGVVIGLSGGIDSSLVAAIAADAIGSGNVTGLFMPSKYTSQESAEDAFGLAANFGIAIRELPIDAILTTYQSVLSDAFKGRKEDTTEENLQARIRGNLLMAFSNKFGCLVLTTGNKSEMSVGYATLYGDMAGGFAVIKDVPKTLVYDISIWRNSVGDGRAIPDRVLWKEPTAELKPDQKDSDTLPPYAVLDPILKAYVEDEVSFEDILKMGCDPASAGKVIRMVDKSEYKRRQAPPGIKITSRAFGRDRRFPITNRYRSY
ncbi:MAG: nadE [Nitrospirae bacterium]|nr:nadE [Nitrospirota bacterium]